MVDKMDVHGLMSQFAAQYVDAMGKAHQFDDWDEQSYVRREAKRAVRELSKIVQAVDTLHMYGIKLA